jgi:hypothetical protein
MFVYFFVFVFLAVVGFELRALHLLGRWSTIEILFCFVFGIGSHVFATLDTPNLWPPK